MAAMKKIYFLLSIFMLCQSIWGAAIWLKSPNGKIKVNLNSTAEKSWFLSVDYSDGKHFCNLFPSIRLGLKRSDADFNSSLETVATTDVVTKHEDYTTLHGKKSRCVNDGNERSVTFRNPYGNEITVVVRAYNDGIAFRYEFQKGKVQTVVMQDEYTTYEIPVSAERWMQRFTPNYEGEFPYQKTNITQGEWGYPSLLKVDGEDCWALISEADVDRNYCATKLSNALNAHCYKLTFPSVTDGNRKGDVNPTISLPWKSPWRVVIIGRLNDIVSSTLVEDVSEPCKLNNTDWIQPGVASWVYWAYNHGTKDYKTVCRYVDLAVEMGWPYVLFDWEWDEMANGGNLEDAVNYAKSKGIKPWIWLNSGGDHTRVMATPRDRVLTHQSRMETFKWLSELGVYGVKVDFFESDKQHMMNYYLDILEDAAQFKLMVNFHGSTVPRGWSRTYPHLMSMEAVFGAEQYNNGSRMTDVAAQLNTTLPFTRNVVGPMDYTPVAFTNSQHPHKTSYAHELALSVIFESGMQHMADRPEGFYALPEAAKDFLRHVPAAWDKTTLIDGYPGKNVVLRRDKGDTIYIAGLNGTDKEYICQYNLDFLPEHSVYKMLLIADGTESNQMNINYTIVNARDMSQLCLPMGGFAARITKFAESDFDSLLDTVEQIYKDGKANTGKYVGVYVKEEIMKLGQAIEKVKSSPAALLDKFKALAAAYSAFCNKGKTTTINVPENM